MKYFLIEKEKSVAEIAAKAYRNLQPAARAEVEAALVRANPELRSPDRMRPGALIRIPSGPGFTELDEREVVDPVKAMIGQVSDRLEALEAEVRSGYAARKKRRKEYETCLKAAARELKKRPEDAARAAKLKKHLRDSMKDDQEKRELGLEALKRLRELAAGSPGRG